MQFEEGVNTLSVRDMWFTLVIVLDAAILLFIPVYGCGIPAWIPATFLFFYYFIWLPSHWPAFRRLRCWEWLRERYFELEVKGPGKAFYLSNNSQDDGRHYVVALHPHTLFAISMTFFFVLNKRFLRYRGVGTSLLFAIPIVREFTAWAGTIHAREADMRHVLLDDEQKGIMMCPGGMREVGNPGIKKRSGFLRIAAETGSWVVPVWSPQERGFYNLWCPLGDFFLDRLLWYPWPILSWGLWWLPFFPKRQKCTLCIGKPFKPRVGDLKSAQEQFYGAIDELKKLV